MKLLGDNERRDELAKRARKLLAGKETQSDSNALVLRRNIRPVGRDVEIYSPPIPRLAPVGSADGRNVTEYNRPAIIELPRWCAVYDEFWLAAYEPSPYGDYMYVTSREFPPHQKNRYARENIITLPPGFMVATEKCACCQTWTLNSHVGAVHCRRCEAWVCYGRTTPAGLFRCRESCGAIGQLVRTAQEETGLSPGRRGGQFGSL